MKSYLEKLDRLPPFVCLLIARNKDGSPVGIKEVARRLGVTPYAARKVLRLQSWRSVPVGTVDQFRAACGVTPETERLQIAYLKRTMGLPTGLRHARHMRHQTRVMLMKLFKPQPTASSASLEGEY